MKNNFAERTAHVLLFAWLLITILLFFIASRASHVQIHLWSGWQEFISTASHIPIFPYVWDVLTALAGVSLFLLSSLAIGLAVLSIGTSDLNNKSALGLTAIVFGEIIFSIIFLTIISVSKLTSIWVTAILLAGLILGATTLYKFFQKHKKIGSRVWQLKPLSSLVLGIIIISTMYSSSRLGYDATVEYFSNAKLMAHTGESILFLPFNQFIVSSLHPGILFTVIIQIFGDQAARMLAWANGIIILLLGLELGAKTGLSTRAQLYFAILLMTSTAFVDLLGDGKVELISTAPLIAAIYWMLQSQSTPTKKVFLLIGVFTGFSIIARPYNIFLVPIFTILFFLAWAYKNLHTHGVAKGYRATLPVFWMLPTLLILGGFHLWQNNLWLGSPIAPLAFAQSLDTSDWQWQFDPTLLTWLRWLYPFTVTFFNTPQSLGNITPLVVGFLPFLLLKQVRQHLLLPNELYYLLLAAFLTLILWITFFFTVVEIRYVFFLWIIIFLWIAKIIESTFSFFEKNSQNLLKGMIALLLFFIMLRTMATSVETYSPIGSSGQAFCDDISLCSFFKEINQTAYPGERIFVLHAYRYYLRPDLFACSSRAEDYVLLQPLIKKDPTKFWTAVYQQGYRYITYEDNFATFHSRFGELPPIDSAPEWLEVEVITSTKKEKVFRLTSQNPPITLKQACVLDKNNTWSVVNLP